MRGEECVDLCGFGFGEAKGDGGDDAFNLMGVAATHDGCSDGGIVKRPGDRYDSRSDFVTCADGFEKVGDGKVAGEQRLLVVLCVAAEVVLGKGGDALSGHGSGEKAGVHRGVVDGADVVLVGEGEYLGFDRSVKHGVRRLVGGDRGDFEGALHLRDAEVGDPDPADFSFALQVGHYSPAFFDVFVGLGPVNLVEVDGFDLETAETVFALSADLLEVVGDLAFVVPDHGAFGEEVGFLRGGFDGFADDLFGVTEAVDGGGVDPVDAEVEGAVYSFD